MDEIIPGLMKKYGRARIQELNKAALDRGFLDGGNKVDKRSSSLFPPLNQISENLAYFRGYYVDKVLRSRDRRLTSAKKGTEIFTILYQDDEMYKTFAKNIYLVGYACGLFIELFKDREYLINWLMDVGTGSDTQSREGDRTRLIWTAKEMHFIKTKVPADAAIDISPATNYFKNVLIRAMQNSLTRPIKFPKNEITLQDYEKEIMTKLIQSLKEYTDHF